MADKARLNVESQRLADFDRVYKSWKLKKLNADAPSGPDWKKWGPYLSDRQWGTVREDYSAAGCAWDYFPHDMARRRAYRWGEDGLAGFSDDRQRLCMGLALWNTHDPILKERLFGLTGEEGNHGEDVKECYYYLDGTPTHSYMKMLYKYPSVEFPYARLVEENRARGKNSPEFELWNTDIFERNLYFDVVVEYAKAGPDDVLMRITVHNRGPEPALLHVLPQLWFRNEWSWTPGSPKPDMQRNGRDHVTTWHPILGSYTAAFEAAPELLFCDNETNVAALYGTNEPLRYPKDAFHDYVVHGNTGAVNPLSHGTKAAGDYRFLITPDAPVIIRMRLSAKLPEQPFEGFDVIVDQRKQDADAFYDDVQRDMADPDARLVQRQAFAGMLWSKQFYYFDVARWQAGDPAMPPPPPERAQGRNADWGHLHNADILSMPDTWEYPWYAAWDLAFHCIPFALIDPEFAKSQLILLTREWYMHPNGQLPAYEWGFSDVNAPVHAWAAWRVFQIDRKKTGGVGDIVFLKRIFHKMLLNFTWWTNRKDAEGHNIFQGGFLGLDNIGIIDRGAPLPPGFRINQSDGTSWMAMYSLNLMRIALELALHDPVYEDVATKFFEHFLYIAKAMTHCISDGVGLWDEQDEFYYDVMSMPGGKSEVMRLRSMVGLIPLFAVETLDPELLERVPDFARRMQWFLDNRPDLASLVSRWNEPGKGERRLLSLLRGHRMKRLLARMLNPDEFLSDYGIRSRSREYKDHPYVYHADGCDMAVSSYQPGESESEMFGGNSNWRGPIWFPVNYLLIESLEKFHHYYGDDFKVECPTGSGKYVSLYDASQEISRRLTRLFLRDDQGKRAVYNNHPLAQTDPHFRDLVLFYEHFHGDTGRGVGAAHQTGWTGLIAKLIHPKDEPVH